MASEHDTKIHVTGLDTKEERLTDPVFLLLGMRRFSLLRERVLVPALLYWYNCCCTSILVTCILLWFSNMMYRELNHFGTRRLQRNLTKRTLLYSLVGIIWAWYISFVLGHCCDDRLHTPGRFFCYLPFPNLEQQQFTAAVTATLRRVFTTKSGAIILLLLYCHAAAAAVVVNDGAFWCPSGPDTKF